MNPNITITLALLLFTTGCTQSTPPPKVPDEVTKGRAVDSALERTPFKAFRLYLNGFHYQSGAPSIQVEEHHFCAKLTEEVTQCMLFDGIGESAHLTGVEYIVARRMVESFQPEERKLWHSHVYEVRSGLAITPNLPEAAEKELMKQLVGTYGKIWHTWNSQHGEQLPTGPAQLMMGFTADGQLKPELLQFRDERLQVSTVEKKKARESIPDPGVAVGVDIQGIGAMQVVMQPVGGARAKRRAPKPAASIVP